MKRALELNDDVDEQPTKRAAMDGCMTPPSQIRPYPCPLPPPVLRTNKFQVHRLNRSFVFRNGILEHRPTARTLVYPPDVRPIVNIRLFEYGDQVYDEDDRNIMWEDVGDISSSSSSSGSDDDESGLRIDPSLQCFWGL
jgi:hypothetical protein